MTGGRLIRILLLAIPLLVGAVGCEELAGKVLGERSYTFKNRSSFTVTVTPDGQDTWSGFAFGAGQDHDVTVEEDDGEIRYLYTPSDKVLAEGPDSGNNVIQFVDR
jgi:hypothetical protein